MLSPKALSPLYLEKIRFEFIEKAIKQKYITDKLSFEKKMNSERREKLKVFFYSQVAQIQMHFCECE